MIAEQTYPIYYVRPRWSEASAADRKTGPAWLFEGLPEGRAWNGSGWYTMEREDRPPEEIAEEVASEWWPKYAETRPDPADLTVEVTFKMRDTWCSGWFSHWTYDIGLSDADVLDSFHRYVHRIQTSGRTESEVGGMLMGAEDCWRWHGCATGEPQGETTPPPCRCKHCKSRGIVRIDH
jgi:hypothetical protein